MPIDLRRRVTAFLRDVAGPRRNPRLNLQLASLLAVTAGALNAVGFVAVSVYTSHMTGITAAIADDLARGVSAVAGVGALAFVAFVGGAMACALLFNWGRRRRLDSRYANVLLLEAVLILVFGLLAEELTWHHRNLVFVAVLCFTMGLQNAVITKISAAQIRTTHVTGMVTDIGIELGKLSYRHRTPGMEPVVGDPRKLAMLSMLVTGFFLGGLLGATGYLRLGFHAVIPFALLLLLVSVAPLARDAFHEQVEEEEPVAGWGSS